MFFTEFGEGRWIVWPLEAVGGVGAGSLSVACGGGLPAFASLHTFSVLKCAGIYAEYEG